jgi:hypothetical protein
MLVNRKLNKSSLRIGELRIGNFVSYQNKSWLITGIDGLNNTVKLSRNVRHSIEVEETVRDIKWLIGVKLWKNESNTGGHLELPILMKLSDFIVEDLSTFRLCHESFTVFVMNDFDTKNEGGLVIYLENVVILKTRFWYLHELQNYIYIICGYSIINEINLDKIFNQ